MTEREFLIYLDPETRSCRYRHYHVSKGKEIVQFRIQLEILVDEEWYSIVRYDTVHGKAYRDILHSNDRQKKIDLKATLRKRSSPLDRKILWKTGPLIENALSRSRNDE